VPHESQTECRPDAYADGTSYRPIDASADPTEDELIPQSLDLPQMLRVGGIDTYPSKSTPESSGDSGDTESPARILDIAELR
jgi:hypothetical protein